MMAEQGVNHADKLKKPLPYIVFVLDEISALLKKVSNTRYHNPVDEFIETLAEKSRAAKIHLLLATQRPTVDVIGGTTKANIMTRLCLRMPTAKDSRVVLDEAGAERLQERGDGLLMGIGRELIRVHTPFITDDGIKSNVQQWCDKKAYQPDQSLLALLGNSDIPLHTHAYEPNSNSTVTRQKGSGNVIDLQAIQLNKGVSNTSNESNGNSNGLVTLAGALINTGKLPPNPSVRAIRSTMNISQKSAVELARRLKVQTNH